MPTALSNPVPSKSYSPFSVTPLSSPSAMSVREKAGATAVGPPVQPLWLQSSCCQLQRDHRLFCLQSWWGGPPKLFRLVRCHSKSSKVPNCWWVCQVCLGRVTDGPVHPYGLTFSEPRLAHRQLSTGRFTRPGFAPLSAHVRFGREHLPIRGRTQILEIRNKWKIPENSA